MTTVGDTFAQPSIFAGARSPEAINCTINAGSSGLDLTEVTSVRFRVRCGGTDIGDRIWDTTILVQRSDRLIVRHVFDTDGVEVRIPGRYLVIPELVYHQEPADPGDDPIPDGIRRAKPFYFGVKP